MTLQLSTTKQFEKDVVRTKKRNKDMSKFKYVLNQLVSQKNLPIKYKNHKLIGNFKDRWECHIEPDWLLIYYMDKEHLRLERMGSHSDLF